MNNYDHLDNYYRLHDYDFCYYYDDVYKYYYCYYYHHFFSIVLNRDESCR